MFAEFRAALHATSLVGLVLAGSMIVPGIVNFASGDHTWVIFFNCAALTGLIWLLIAVSTANGHVKFSRRFGLILVNMLWWLLPLATVPPLMFGPANLSFADALFETASGFTTTGSTVIMGLDTLDPGTLIWRSLIQWFGGLGILSVGLLLLPFLKVGGLQLFRLESSDKFDIPMPRFIEFSKSVVSVYAFLSASCAIGFLLTGMGPFDAVNHAMTTLSTGGYSTHDASFGFFPNTSTIWVGSIFMAAGGLPFTLFVMLLFTRKKLYIDPQVYGFFIIIAAASFIILLGRQGAGAHTARGVAEDVFNVISVITTTGYVAGDYEHWSPLAAPLFFLLTFFGGCAGSTAGGLKIYRLIVLVEMVRAALREMVYPNGVFVVRYGHRTVDNGIFRSALVFTIAFAGILGLCTLILGAQGNDFVASLTGSLTALTNVGPGLGSIIGPAGNFAALPDSSKYTLAAAMIAGRLEIMVVLALFMPMLWRQS